MTTPSFRPKVFVSYSHRDRGLKEKFDDNLRVLRDQQIIDFWTDGEIQAGDHWSDEITNALNEANLILFLVSNHFLASSFIRHKEAPMAMVRQNRGQAVIVPIILSKTPGWQKEEWNTLQALPSQVKPIDHPDWRSPENAFAEVEEKLRELIEDLPQKLAKQAAQWKVASQGDGLSSDTSRQVGGQQTLSPPTRRKPSRFKWASLAALLLILGVGLSFFLNNKQNVSEPDISPELRDWLNAPKVDHTVLEVFAPKGNGFIQNGIQPLVTGKEIVAARRVPELVWEDAAGKPLISKNGLVWEMIMKGVAGPIAKPVTIVSYFAATKANSSNSKSSGIKIDPTESIGYGPVDSTDSPPGFTYANAVAGVPVMLWDQPTVSANFFTGSVGNIPEGIHRMAFELKIEGKPVYRGLMNLKVPPYIFAQPQEEWVRSLAESKIDVSVVENSTCWPSETELAWKVQLKGDPTKLSDPLSFHCHYLASDTYNTIPQAWIVDPHRDSRICRSVEIEGFNFWEFCWGWGGVPAFKDNIAIQPLALHCGPRGKFQGGQHRVALEVFSCGEPIWRGILKLDLPQQAWSLPEEKNKLILTDAGGKDIRGAYLIGQRAAPDVANGRNRTVGLLFGPLRFVNKGEALSGPFSVQFYLKAVPSPQKPSGAATISVSPKVFSVISTPDPGGFTAFGIGGAQLQNQSGIKDAADEVPMLFHVGDAIDNPGEIPAGFHEIGIEVLGKDNISLYRGITNVELR